VQLEAKKLMAYYTTKHRTLCATLNMDKMDDINWFRETCDKKCGFCCQQTYCGPWLPCEFFDKDNTRIDVDKILIPEAHEQTVHDIDWRKVITFISRSYATVSKDIKWIDVETGKYYLDVPKTEHGTCSLLTKEGCLLDFENRPLIGASSICGEESWRFGRETCWTNDAFLNKTLAILYIMEQNGNLQDLDENEIENRLQVLREIKERTKQILSNSSLHEKELNNIYDDILKEQEVKGKRLIFAK